MYRIEYVDLPCKIHGLTAYYFDEDGQAYYTIIVNSRDSVDRQNDTINHELKHIMSDDLDRMIPLEEIELARHGLMA
ncbi:MAG: hypothetical protein HXM76_06955 [Mogibacterium diversum]|nr:hypothetical protein [Mogibacterium diversum]